MIPPISGQQNPRSHDALRQAAIELEANFLSEMLKGAGFGKSPETFGGGAGEDQFSSLLRQEQAREMARAGGIGLAEVLFQSLTEQQNDPATNISDQGLG